MVLWGHEGHLGGLLYGGLSVCYFYGSCGICSIVHQLLCMYLLHRVSYGPPMLYQCLPVLPVHTVLAFCLILRLLHGQIVGT